MVLTPTDMASARALAEITADNFRKLGMNVEAPAPGWPESPTLESLRDAWFAAQDIDTQKDLANRLQL